MKKIILLSILLISLSAFAQSDNSFGIKFGTNYSQFTPDIGIPGFELINYKGKIGYYIGGFVNFPLSDEFSLQPELLFANQGTKQDSGEIHVREIGSGDETVGNVITNLNEFSILIPIIVQMKLSEVFFIEAGPQAGYSLKRTLIIKKNPFEPSTEGEKFTDTEGFDKFDIGLNVGVGFDISQKLGMNLRYSLGLLERDDIYKTSVINLGLTFKI